MEDEMATAAKQHCTRAWYMRPPVWVLAVVLLGVAAFGAMEMIKRPAPITYGDFLNQLDAGNVASVTFTGTQIYGDFKHPVEQAATAAPQTNFRSEVPSFGDSTLLLELRKQHVTIDVASSSSWVSWLGRLPWPMVLIIGGVLIAGLVKLMRRDTSSTTGSPLPTHPMMGLISGLLGKKDQQASHPPGGDATKAPPSTY
jgi:ATP-dependent Zn protease